MVGGFDIPLRNLVAEVGVAAATDQLDLVCHLGGHSDEILEGPVGRQDQSRKPLNFLLLPSYSC